MKSLEPDEVRVIYDNIKSHIENMVMRRKMTCPACQQLEADIREGEKIRKQIEYFSDMKE